MIDQLDYINCSLCQACYECCPQKCIHFSKEKESFFYPVIDSTRCIHCNRCEKVCPVLSPVERTPQERTCYVGKHKNEQVRMSSSSGGVFFAVAKGVLDRGGVVYGAAFDSQFHVIHTAADTIDDLKPLQTSKYVQSNINGAYRQVKEALQQGQEVLFSGCPCQVAGLHSFLGRFFPNLTTLDFICHGVPSQKTFDEYLRYMQNKFHGDVERCSFRDKSRGWNPSSLAIQFKNGRIYLESWLDDIYMRGFLRNIFLKPACYACPFKNCNSGSDLTLGDFWGAEVYYKEQNDNRGLSLVIANSEKGDKIVDGIKECTDLKPFPFEQATRYNPLLFSSAVPDIRRSQFHSTAEKSGYKRAFEKFCKIRISEYALRTTRFYLSQSKRFILRNIPFLKLF